MDDELIVKLKNIISEVKEEILINEEILDEYNNKLSQLENDENI